MLLTPIIIASFITWIHGRRRCAQEGRPCSTTLLALRAYGWPSYSCAAKEALLNYGVGPEGPWSWPAMVHAAPIIIASFVTWVHMGAVLLRRRGGMTQLLF